MGGWALCANAVSVKGKHASATLVMNIQDALTQKLTNAGGKDYPEWPEREGGEYGCS
jgi:hypothetical protein